MKQTKYINSEGLAFFENEDILGNSGECAKKVGFGKFHSLWL